MPIFGAEMIIFCLKIVVLVGSLLHIRCCFVNKIYIYLSTQTLTNDVTFLGRVDGNLVGVFIYFVFFFLRWLAMKIKANIINYNVEVMRVPSPKYINFTILTIHFRNMNCFIHKTSDITVSVLWKVIFIIARHRNGYGVHLNNINVIAV